MNILCDIFSEARGMLMTFYNHLITTGNNRLVADAEEKNQSLMVIKSIAIEFLPPKLVGLEVNTTRKV